MKRYLEMLPHLISALTCIGPAATLHRATAQRRQSRGQTFFGARVQATFADTPAGAAVIAQFRWRLWLGSLACGALSLIVPLRLAMLVSMLGAGTAGSIAFALASRRTRREAEPQSPPAIRVASLNTGGSVDSRSRWLHLPLLDTIDWLGMLLPPAMPAAILMYRVLNPGPLLSGPAGALAHRAPVFALILGLSCAANVWALRYRTRGSDWAPTPEASRQYRTYLGALQSMGLGSVAVMLCGFSMISPHRPAAAPVACFAFALLFAFPVSRMRSWLASHIATNSLDPMPDSCWKWGSWYFNREDPVVYVPLRTGVGQSMNLARPSVLAAYVVLTAAAVAMVVQTATLHLPDR